MSHCQTNTTGARQGCAETHVHFLQARRLPTLLLLFCCLSLRGFDSSAQIHAGRVVAWNAWGGSWPDVRPGSVTFTNVDCGRLGITSEGRVLAWPDATFPVPPNLSNVVATAGNHLALKSDGTVVAWAHWTNYTPNLTGVKAIAASDGHALALLSNGTVTAWGPDNRYGQTNVPAGLSDVVAITVGNHHSVALKADGSVEAWGAPWATTVPPTAVDGVARVIAGGDNSIAILSNGTVVAWGGNDAVNNVPPDLTGVVSAACGNTAAVAVRSNGSVAVWGTGRPPEQYAFAGRGLTNVPPGLADVIDVSVNFESAMARKRDGTFIGWGVNAAYEATLPPFHTGIVSLGSSSSLRQQDAFFLNRAGRLESTGFEYAPPPPDLTNVVAFARGGPGANGAISYNHNLALRRDGTVVAWGDNPHGQTDVPAGLSNVVAVSAGGYHSVALRADGRVVAWGLNNFGQTNVPPSLTGVKAISAGAYYNIALRSNGTMVTWGLVPPNQPDLNDVVAVSAGNASPLALRSNGRVVAWGINNFGQTNVPAGLSNVVAIAAGFFHSLALRSDGSVVAWGTGAGPGLPVYPVPAGLRNVISIATSGDDSYAIVLDPQLSIRRDGSNVVLGFRSFLNQAYQIQYSTDLIPNSWFNLPGGNVTGTGANMEVTDSNVVPDQPQRFYRLVEVN